MSNDGSVEDHPGDAGGQDQGVDRAAATGLEAPADVAGPMTPPEDLVEFLPAASPPTGFLFADRANRPGHRPPDRRLPRRIPQTRPDPRLAEGKEMRMFSVEVAKILLVSQGDMAPKPSWSLPMLRSGTAVAATLFAVAFLGSALAVPHLVAPAADLVPASGSVSYGFDAPRDPNPGNGGGSDPPGNPGGGPPSDPGSSSSSSSSESGSSSSASSGPSSSSSSSGPTESPSNGANDVAVCRVLGNGDSHTVWVNQAAADNLQGDDYLGECSTGSESSSSSSSSESSSSSSSSETGSESSSSSNSESSSSSSSSESSSSSSSSTGSPNDSGASDVAVCRVLGNGDSQTVYVNQAAAEHLQGDDYLGECVPEDPPGNETDPEGNETLPDGNETDPEGNETIPDGNETEPDGNDTDPDDRRGGGGGGRGRGQDSAPSPESSPGPAASASGGDPEGPPSPQAKPPEEVVAQPEPPGEAVGLPGFVTLGFEVAFEATGAGVSRRRHSAPEPDAEEPSAE